MPRVNRPSPGSIPAGCFMHPGRMSDPDGFYLFEHEVNMADTQGVVRIHISAEGARTLARKFPEADLVPGRDARMLQVELDAAQEKIKELEAQVAELEAFKQNLAGLSAHGFDLRKKKGPQVKAEEVVV